MLPAPADPDRARASRYTPRLCAAPCGRELPRMNPNFLDFEQPIADLDAKIQELRHASHGQAFNIEDEVKTLEGKLKVKTAEIFRSLTPWQVAQVARHPA